MQRDVRRVLALAFECERLPDDVLGGTGHDALAWHRAGLDLLDVQADLRHSGPALAQTIAPTARACCPTAAFAFEPKMIVRSDPPGTGRPPAPRRVNARAAGTLQ